MFAKQYYLILFALYSRNLSFEQFLFSHKIFFHPSSKCTRSYQQSHPQITGPQLLYQMQQEGNRSSSNLLTLSNPRPKVHRKPRRKIIKSDSSDTERQLYFPDLFEYKKLDLAPQGKRIIKGSWSLQQNRIYLQFLQKYYKDFSSEQARRKTVVFNRLSKHLQKRTPDQCRSHHQKLQNRFANKIDAIIRFVEEKIKKKELKMMMRGDGGMEKEMSLPKTSDVTEEEEGLVLDFEELEIW